MAVLLDSIKGGITRKLNSKVMKRAEKILILSGNKKITQKEFNKAYNVAIVEFGYKPAYFKKKMSEIFNPYY